MVVLLCQTHLAKRKQGVILKTGKTIISTSTFDTEEYAVLIRRSLMGTTELIENCNRYQFIGYSQLNKYICSCLKLLKNQIDSGHSVISMEHIKYERVCMLMNMVQLSNWKYVNSTYKEKIISSITPYQLIRYIDGIKEALLEHNNALSKFSLAGLCGRMFFLIIKCRILRGKSLFQCGLSYFWGFMKLNEELHTLHCVFSKHWTIFATG